MPKKSLPSGGMISGIRSRVRQVIEHATSLVRLERELVTLELKKKAATLGIGVALVAVAALLAVYMIGFLFATIAAGFATFLALWLSLLLVTLLLLGLVAALAALGVRQIKKAQPPLPEQAIREAQLTQEALKR
jgi:hypothetical protein